MEWVFPAHNSVQWHIHVNMVMELGVIQRREIWLAEICNLCNSLMISSLGGYLRPSVWSKQQKSNGSFNSPCIFKVKKNRQLILF